MRPNNGATIKEEAGDDALFIYVFIYFAIAITVCWHKQTHKKSNIKGDSENRNGAQILAMSMPFCGKPNFADW